MTLSLRRGALLSDRSGTLGQLPVSFCITQFLHLVLLRAVVISKLHRQRHLGKWTTRMTRSAQQDWRPSRCRRLVS